jgi:hypothetical protein
MEATIADGLTITWTLATDDFMEMELVTVTDIT